MHIEQLVPMVYVYGLCFYHEMILFHLCLSPKLFSFFDFSEMPGPD